MVVVVASTASLLPWGGGTGWTALPWLHVSSIGVWMLIITTWAGFDAVRSIGSWRWSTAGKFLHELLERC
jgi:hypothetical protein